MKPPLGLRPTNETHEAAYQDMIAALAKHGLSGMEMLAVASNLVGKLVAMQDQRKITPAQALEIVAKNVEEGNKRAIAGLLKLPTKGVQ